MTEEDKAFCSVPRYPSEVAEYLNVSKPTLMVWIQDIEKFDYFAYINSNRRLFTPREVCIILEDLL